MTDERWARVKALFQAAVEQPADGREAFLAAAAAGDETLRSEVESLLASDSADVSFIDRFALASEADPADSPGVLRASMSQTQSHLVLNPGHRIGSYEVVALLGVGGMGQVYRCRDPRLNREVALKVLPGTFTLDPDRLARFRREAQLLAALNHPNIAAIYGLEESTSGQALVLELVEGPTLADRIAEGPIPPGQALSIAKQIADALEAAHEQGIIHRDLKPSNIKVRPDGLVKVLDFGLAKALTAEPTAGEHANPTKPQQSAGATSDGVLLGTAAYMSPEQAKGQAVEKRADIWSFGCVLFEMLAGRPVFHADTVTDLLAAVVKEEDPDWTALPDGMPSRIHTLLQRCLKKDPRRRLQAIGDARIEIEEAQSAPQVERTVGRSGLRLPERAAWVGAAGALTLVAAGALIREPRPAAELPETRLEIRTPATTDPASMAISPDGQKIVFSAPGADGRPQLWIRFLSEESARPLASTEGARYPFWSPDARSIGFFADGRLMRVAAEGGAVLAIANAPLGLGGTWNRAGTIVFSPNWVGPLYRVSDSGGEPTEVTRLNSGQSGHRFPHFLPDGRHFLFESIESGAVFGAVYVGNIEGAESRPLVGAGAGATYTASGYLMFARGRPAAATLLAQNFDPERLALAGNPVPVAEAINVGLDPGRAALSVSSGGIIAYRPDSVSGQGQLAWFDRAGHEIGKLGNPDSASSLNPSLSPDGRRVAVRRSLGEDTDIWLLDTKTALLSRLTASTGLHNYPIWSPDNRRVAFIANPNRAGLNDLYWKSVDGTGKEELLLATPQNKGPSDWSPDGRFVLFRSVDPKTGNDIWAMPVVDGKPFPVVQTNFDERDGQFSPDGKWIAYQSNETGSFEVWAQSFPVPGTRLRISNNGGTQVRWRRDGKELFYIATNGRLMAVPVEFGPQSRTLDVGTPVPLFVTRIGGAWQGNNRQQYMVAPDGQRFLMNTVVAEATSTITVIQNWKRRPN